MQAKFQIRLRDILCVGGLMLLLALAMPHESYGQDNRAKTEKEKRKDRKKRIKSRKLSKADRAASNRKQVRRNKPRGRKADRASKGDITGRKFRADRTPRKTYARPAENPYAGRKMDPRKAERAGPTPPPNFRTPPRGEQPRKGDITGRRRIRTVSGRSASKSTYSQPAVRSASRKSERSVRTRRGDIAARSASRSPERSRPSYAATPKSISGGGKVTRKRNPYAGKEQRRGERATNRDIAGRKLRTRGKMSAKPAPKRGYSRPDTYYGRKSTREGGRFSRGAMAAGGYSSGSKSSEQAATARRSDPATKNYQTPRKAAGQFQRKPNVPSQPTDGKRFKDRKTAVRSVSRGSERKVQAQVTVPRSISGGAKISKSKNPYAGREQRAGERATDKDIAGRKLRTRNYRSPRPKWKGRIGNPDPYYARDERDTKVKTSPVPTYVPGRNQMRASGFQGRTKAKPALAGGGGSISGRSWNNKGRPVQSPGYVNPKISRYQGRQKASPQLSGGGGSISGRSWNNKGRPVQSPGYVNPKISRYQGNQKAKPTLSGGGGSISGRSWNNKGRPVQSPGYVNPKISRYQGNVKAQRQLKGGGSISRSGWNNKGRPIAGPGNINPAISRYQGNVKAQRQLKGGGSISRSGWNNKGRPIAGPGNINPAISRYQGNMKVSRELKGGGSISRSGWNNKGKPVTGPGYVNPKISNYQGDMLPNPGYFNTSIGRYKGENKVPRARMQKNGRLPQKLPGAETAKATKYQGNMIPNPGYFNPSIGRYQGEYKVKEPKKGGGSISGKLWNNNEKPLARLVPQKDARKLSFYQGNQNAKDNKRPKQSDGTEWGTARGVAMIVPPKANKYGWSKIEKPGQLNGSTYGRVRSLNFITPQKAKKYGGFVAMDGKVKGTEGTKYGRTTTFSFYTPAKVKRYGGWAPVETRVSKRQMHPSASYARGSIKSSTDEKNKTFKFGIWWASLFKRNENQPEDLKKKESKPRYDKREVGLWYE